MKIYISGKIEHAICKEMGKRIFYGGTELLTAIYEAKRIQA